MHRVGGGQIFFFQVKKKVFVKRVYGFFSGLSRTLSVFHEQIFIKISRTFQPFHGHFVKNFHECAVQQKLVFNGFVRETISKNLII